MAPECIQSGGPIESCCDVAGIWINFDLPECVSAAFVWASLLVILISTQLFSRSSSIYTENRFRKVFFVSISPEPAASVGIEIGSDWRQVVRNYAQNLLRCSCNFKTLASTWMWPLAVILQFQVKYLWLSWKWDGVSRIILSSRLKTRMLHHKWLYIIIELQKNSK